MDNSIDTLKGSISTTKEELKDLNAGTFHRCLLIVAHQNLSTSLPTTEIQARIAVLEEEVVPL
jgi:hypothetical protein